MSVPNLLRQVARGFRNRRAVRSLEELDDRRLADIGLLRADVHASLHRSYVVDPSRVLKAVCCHWLAYMGRSRPVPGAALCCE